MQNNLYVGVDVGGTKIAGGIVSNRGELLCYQKIPTPARASASQVAAHIKSLIRELLKKYAITPREIKGIGLGVPGAVKPNRRDILVTPNINLAGYPLARNLEQAFKTKVVLGNDVNLGILAEKYFGIGSNVNDLVGIFLGTGVGGGIVINGKLHEGALGVGAELGHMYIDLSSKKQSAGLTGTLEALIGRRSLERDIKEEIRLGQKTIVTKILGKNFNVIKSSVLARALKEKDPLIMKVMDHLCFVLGSACISLRHILNPQMIVLGGGIIEACGSYIIPKVQKISNTNPFLKGIDDCKIVRSILGDDAVILGGVVLLKQTLGERLSQIRSYYPQLKVGKHKTVSLNGKPCRNNFFLRADGELKSIEGQKAFAALKKNNEIDVPLLRKICKKGPQTLIVGYRQRAPKVLAEAKKYLRDKSILPEILPLGEAVEYFNGTHVKKVFILI